MKRLLKRGDYIGSHSYGHLHYVDYRNLDTVLLSKNEFVEDLRRCYEVMAKCGITQESARYFMPPFEEYNATIASWAKSLGLQVVNFTPGTGSNADYTTPDMPNYRSSRAIYDKIMNEEKSKGLNGHILLIHLGTDAARTDKFYDDYLEKMIKTLLKKGYVFTLLPESVALGNK